ncbi:MAG TPA: acyltransferase family protein [Actinomycetes bacterium]|nr:acyltransferase family protein [Actinomycetes bacterium]
MSGDVGSVIPEATPQPQQAPSHRRQRLPFHHRPALDGIRAIAALLVVLFHSDVPFLDNGYAGVDVFFVLSGFLITSLLIREIDVDHRVNIIAFYARRARRLLPVALTVLLVTAVAFRFIVTPLEVAEARGGFIAAALYVANWFFLAQSQDYFAADDAPSPVLHYWSLAVEEQFYFVWPILLLLLVLLAKRYRVDLRWIVTTLAVGGVFYAGWLSIDHPMESYFGTLAREYQLMIGAIVALTVFRWQSGRAKLLSFLRGTSAAQILSAVGLAVMLTAASPLLGGLGPFGRGALSCLGTALLVVGLEVSDESAIGRGLKWGPARRIGAYSYAMYLWHWPVIVLGDDLDLLPTMWVPRAIIVVSVTIGLSALTSVLIEKPMGRISLSSQPRRRTVAIGGLLAALMTAAAMLVILPVNAQTEKLVEAITAENDPARYATTVAVTGSTDPNAKTVLLIGDSHGRFWVNGAADLAAEQGWRLVSVRRNGCAWPNVDRVDPAIDGVRDYCQEFRDKALEVAEQEQPDVTLLVGRSLLGGTAAILTADSTRVTAGDPEWIEAIKSGTDSYLKDLAPFTGSMVLIEPIPETETPMAACLSTDTPPDECSQPSIDPPGAELVETYWRSLESDPAITSLDVDDLICPDHVCPAMVGDVITHQDSHHLTDAYAALLMPDIEKRLAETGPNLAALN